MISFAQIFDSLKIVNVSNIFLEKGAVKKTKNFLLFLNGHYCVMGGPIDMNVGVF